MNETITEAPNRYDPYVHDALKRRHAELCDQMNALLKPAEAEDRKLHASEKRDFDALTKQVEDLNTALAQHDELASRIAAIAQANREFNSGPDNEYRASAETTSAATGERRSNIYLGAETSVYRPDTRDLHGREYGFFSDIVAASRGD